MNRLERLAARRTDPAVTTAKMLNEAYRQIRDTEGVRYAIGAMQPIDPEYTRNTFREGERVRDQLGKRIEESCDFEFQGSTTNDTHIKAKSDIDLLAIINRWSWLAPGLPNESPYVGDARTDVRNLRLESEQAVRDAFPQADLNTSGSIAISIEGASLRRRIEVVPATWYNTVEYHTSGNKVHRGVRVFDKNSGEFSLNQPFLFNLRVDEKDTQTSGGMRKAARLMKSLKYDSATLDMSSYNLVSIAWNTPDHLITHPHPRELRILEGCHAYCVELRNDSLLRNSLWVPDGSRLVFDGKGGATVAQLDALITELEGLIRDIFREARRSFTRLAEARVDYAY